MRLDKKTMDELQIVSVDGTTYIGFFNDNKIEDAARTTEIVQYVHEAYMGRTQTITIGKTSTYTARGLIDEEKAKLNTLLDNLSIAEVRAPKKLILDYISANFR